jgi:lysophospholipase L1-like esterase
VSYDKQIWANGPSGNTPINADRLNHMEDGIEEVSQEVSAIEDAVAALAAQYAPLTVAAQTVAKLRAGTGVTICYIGDSGLEGTTVSTLGNDAASRVKTAVDARFGVTTTKANRAKSGRTLGTALMTSAASPTMLENAITDAADLYVISFGHNDIRSDVSSTFAPGTGYPSIAGQAALEHIIRKLRIEVPDADIVVSSSWPYTGASVASNDSLERYHAAYRDVALAYGCLWVDYYQALVDLGVGSGSDNTYVWPTGDPSGFAQHPNDTGHDVWANLITDLLPDRDAAASTPAVPALPVFGADRYTQAPWVHYGPTRNYGVDGFRLVGAGWDTILAVPATTSTAGNQIEVQWIGHEAVVRLDTGASQATVKIVIDGTLVNATLDLSALGTGQRYIPLPVYTPGVHRAVITVVSGSLTCRGVEIMPAIGQYIPTASALVARTGTWTLEGNSATRYGGSQYWSTTQNDSFVVEWVGTDLAAQMTLYTSAWSVDITTDGVTRASVTFTASESFEGNFPIESDLPYGRHSTTVTLKSSGGSRRLVTGAMFAYDRRRTQRPDSLSGLAISAETVDYGHLLPSVPQVMLAADDSTNAIPPYPTSNAVTGFVSNGTVTARQSWLSRFSRAAW